jgi:hypothetical protein
VARRAAPINEIADALVYRLDQARLDESNWYDGAPQAVYRGIPSNVMSLPRPLLVVQTGNQVTQEYLSSSYNEQGDLVVNVLTDAPNDPSQAEIRSNTLAADVARLVRSNHQLLDESGNRVVIWIAVTNVEVQAELRAAGFGVSHVNLTAHYRTDGDNGLTYIGN